MAVGTGDRLSNLEPAKHDRPRPSILVAQDPNLIPEFGKQVSLTYEDIKAMPFQERLSIFTDGKDGVGGLGIRCTTSEAMIRIEEAYEKQEDKNVLEMAVDFIDQHKRIDPIGVLFDFNSKNSVRTFERELGQAPSRKEEKAIAKRGRKKKDIDRMKGGKWLKTNSTCNM
jgi:hypothetical protein